MNHILSFLSRSTISPIPPQQTEPNPAPKEGGVKCRGWARPDLTIRLRQETKNTKEIIRILGYPEPADIPPSLSFTGHGAGFGNAGSPFLYLRGTVPAYVDYIMGNDWRSRLRGHGPQDWSVILRNQDDDDEGEHCLRMRRCGATAVRSEVDIIATDGEGRRLGPWPDYPSIFGWPKTGGVWILRDIVDDGPFSQAPIDGYDFAVEDEIQERFWNATQRLKQQHDMAGVCRLIEEAGGQFYPIIEECFEVVYFRLLE